MRILIADDAMLTREGIAHLLEQAGHEVVGQAPDAGRLLVLVERSRPDVVVVDIECRRRTPTRVSLRHNASGRQSRVGVLVLSQYIEPSYAMRLVQDHPEGVGYPLKERVFDVAILIDALQRIADGETVVDPTIVAQLFGRRRKRRSAR